MSRFKFMCSCVHFFIFVVVASWAVAFRAGRGDCAPFDNFDLPALEAKLEPPTKDSSDRAIDGGVADPSSSPSLAPEDQPPPWRRFEGLAEAQKAMQTGNPQLAMEHLRDAAAANPFLPPPKVIFAELLISSGQVAAGKQVLESVANEQPEHSAIYILFGQIALGEGRLTDAQVHFEKAERLSLPEDWPAEIHQTKRRVVLSGQASVAQLRGNWDEAEEYLRKLVPLSPTDARVRDRWAQALFHAGQEKMAYEQFDLAYRQDDRLDRPEISMAALYMQAGKYDQATNWYQHLLNKQPDDATVQAEVSGAMFILGNATIAKQHADKAAALGLDSLALSMQRGMIASQLGQFAEAEAFFSEALEKSPDNLEAQCQRLIALVEQDDQAKRDAALSQAIELTRAHPQSLRAQTTAGWIRYRLGQADEAEPLLRAAARDGNGHPEAVYFLAHLLYENNKQEEARQLAARLKPYVEQPGLFVPRLAARKWLNELESVGP